MRLAPFEDLVRAMCDDIPAEYFDGVTEVVVSPRVVPHPVRADIFTLGECIPLPLEDGGTAAIQSRVVLYHGSFAALAERDPAFDWRAEAWETLTHELRHHVEWRARRDDLEGFDRAAEQHWARQGGEAFDPLYFLDAQEVAPGVRRIDEDWILEQVVRRLPSAVEVEWQGRRHRGTLPDGVTLPAFLTLEGLAGAPDGEVVLVLRRPTGFRDLFRRHPPWRGAVAVIPVLEG